MSDIIKFHRDQIIPSHSQPFCDADSTAMLKAIYCDLRRLRDFGPQEKGTYEAALSDTMEILNALLLRFDEAA